MHGSDTKLAKIDHPIVWEKGHQQCIAQQINIQASNWNTGNILLIEGTRSYPTIPPSRSFAEIRVVLPVLVSLVAWLLLQPAQAPDLRESWRWLDGAGWGWWRSMLRCAPGFYTIAAGAITLGRAREQRAAQESRFELWPLEASCQPSASPPPTAAYLPWCAICNILNFCMPILSGHYLVILHPIPSGKMKMQLFPPFRICFRITK